MQNLIDLRRARSGSLVGSELTPPLHRSYFMYTSLPSTAIHFADQPPRKRSRWAYRLLAITLFLLFIASFPFLWRAWIQAHYADQIYTTDAVSATRVAIVFGARVYGDGRLSAMVRDRVDTAVDLYKAGKVQKLLISGDNQFDNYDEPGDMMTYAIRQGVPAQAIQPDYGGRRTYDTCYRAKAIFQVQEAILVTQAFHLPRALFLCENLGVQAAGVAADRRVYAPAFANLVRNPRNPRPNRRSPRHHPASASTRIGRTDPDSIN